MVIGLLYSSDIIRTTNGAQIDDTIPDQGRNSVGRYDTVLRLSI